jgi:hypothetical protein
MLKKRRMAQYFSSVKKEKKNCQTRIFYPARMSFRMMQFQDMKA